MIQNGYGPDTYLPQKLRKFVKIGIVIAVVAVAIIAIILGLIAYSYTQIHFTLESVSYQGLDLNLTAGSTIKAIFNGILGNWLGAALDLITGVKLGLGFGLSNHGFFPVYIPDVSYDLLVNDVKVGQGQSHIEQTINPGETKSIADTQDIQFSSLKPALSSILDSGGIIDFKVKGTAFFNFLGLSVPVPFEATRQVNLVDELKSRLEGNSQNSAAPATNYYSPPTESTSINIQASTYSVTEGQTVTLSGRLAGSGGTGISNQVVYVKRDISLAPDSVLGTAYTDSNGYFTINWISTKPITSNTANVYATFEGSSQYSSSRSLDITIQVNSYQPAQTTQGSITLNQQLQLARQNSQSSQSSSITTAQHPAFQVANSIYKVSPGTYTYIPFNMQCSGTLSGAFSAHAALGNNIMVFVVDPTGFRQLQAGSSFNSYYDSEKVASGTINIGLASGQYYLVLSNTYSAFSTKTVDIAASYSCS